MENAPAVQNDDNTAAQKLKEIKELVNLVWDLKSKADVAEKAYKAAKNRLAEIMENAEVEKMAGDDCNVSLNLKTSCTVPKEDHKKKELFEYIEKEHGKEVLFDMLTINANTFSSWHTKEIERKIVETDDYEFQLPMVKPYEYYSLGIRKKAKRKA